MKLQLFSLLLLLSISTHLLGQSATQKAPFRFAEISLNDPAKVAISYQENDPQFFIVQLKNQAALSASLYEGAFYLGEHTYIIRTKPSQLEWWFNDNMLAGWAPYTPELKIHPDLKGLNDITVLEVVLNKNFSSDHINEVFHNHRIPVSKRMEGAYFAVIKNQKGVIEKLAALDEVIFIHPGGRKSEPEDVRSKILHRSDLLEGPGDDDLGFDGEGVNVLVRDDGMIGPHLDFKGRLFNDPDLPFETNRTHGDGVAGIIGAAGSVETSARGMAPGANIYAKQYEASFLDNTLQLHINDDVLYTNSSYSNGCNDGYTPNAAEVDRQIYEYPTLLHIFSAGNSNGRDCGYGAGDQWGNITGGHKQSKNSIATANVNPFGSIMFSSSRGPATDGRLKPDIAANGNNNYSTIPNNNYSPFGGTSGAAPCVAGVAAQLCEAYRSLYGTTPPSALIKACMLNAADDSGVEGPDYVYGWGLLDAYGAYKILENEQFAAGVVTENDQSVLLLDMPDTAAQVKIMLYWADPPGLPMAPKALVNDLDLTATYKGENYLPLVLDPTPNMFSLDDPASPGIDTLNNMEQIIIENASGGQISVTISGSSIPSGTQEFYLVYEIMEPEGSFEWIQPTPGAIYEPGEGVQLQWINNITDANIKTILYSVDGGSSWSETTSFSSSDFYTLRLDSAESGDSLLVGLIEGNYSDTLMQAVYFAEKHQFNEIKVEQVCPSEALISWEAKENADTYRVYILGEKYMEIYQETPDTFMTVPVKNPIEGQIYAVSSSYNGIWAPRSDGRLYKGGLLNCPQLIELAADTINVLNPVQIYYCQPYELEVTARISNMGIEDVDSFEVCYRLNEGPASCQWFTFNFQSGTDTLLTLDSTLTVDTTHDELEYWVNAPGDDFYFNDTMIEPVTISFLTDEQILDSLNLQFEDFRLPPLSKVVNPDQDLTWDWVFGTNKANEESQMLVMPNYFYMETGQVDAFYTPVVSLDSFMDPQLIFDYAYSGIAGSPDELIVVVAEPCDIYNADTLWKGEGLDMATTDVGFDNFQVSNYDEWESVRLSLSEYVGQEIVLGFISVNHYGNNIYLDNISIMPDSTFQHEIQVDIYPNDTACIDSLVRLTVDIDGSGDFKTKWFNTTVRSNTVADTFEFQLDDLFQEFVVFVSNQYYTTYEKVFIEKFDNPRVGPRLVEQTEDTVIIASRAINYDSIVWFGDNGAILRGDTVRYVRQNGEERVRFTAIAYGKCATASRGITLDFTVNNEDAFDQKITAYPNPVNDELNLLIKNGDRAEMELYDYTGKLLLMEKIQSFRQIDLSGLPNGIYHLNVRIDGERYHKKIVIQQ